MEANSDVVEEVINAYGGVKGVQDRFGYETPMSVYVLRTRGIPKSHMLDIHLEKGFDPKRLQESTLRKVDKNSK